MYETKGPRKWKKSRFLKGHSSYITHIDWSVGGENLQSNCGAYEILFWDAESKQRDPSGASALRDEKWASWTCVIGFPVQEIWRGSEDGTDVNAVDRSHNAI